MGDSVLKSTRSPDWIPAALLRAVVVLLCVVAIWFFAWPIYRAFHDIEISRNEGWNAYWADAAMGRMPLYPSSEQLITNNYPPLSFYVVGAIGKLLGDSILAGRLLSLLAVIVIAIGIASTIKWLGGNRMSAGIGAVYFVAIMNRYYFFYIGMNDPQLFAQAIMIFGFLAFLRSTEQDRGYMAPILVMVIAGFIKHNIIAMPLTAFVWLAIRRPRQIVKCVALAAVAVVIGFAVCFVFYGHDFLTNMLTPRSCTWQEGLDGVRELRPLAVSFAVWAYIAWTKHCDCLANLSHSEERQRSGL
jgi:hypothetical protein